MYLYSNNQINRTTASKLDARCRAFIVIPTCRLTFEQNHDRITESHTEITLTPDESSTCLQAYGVLIRLVYKVQTGT